MADTRPEFHTALHQAGHAVVAHVLELPFRHVSLGQDEQGLGQRLHGEDPASSWEDARDRVATVSVAGRVALEMHAGTVPRDPLDSPDQWVAASEVERHREEARAILKACWPAVTALADLLITRERVTAADVQSLVRSTTPEMARQVAHDDDATAPTARRPTGAADSADTADALPEGAMVGGVDEGGGD